MNKQYGGQNSYSSSTAEASERKEHLFRLCLNMLHISSSHFLIHFRDGHAVTTCITTNQLTQLRRKPSLEKNLTWQEPLTPWIIRILYSTNFKQTYMFLPVSFIMYIYCILKFRFRIDLDFELYLKTESYTVWDFSSCRLKSPAFHIRLSFPCSLNFTSMTRIFLFKQTDFRLCSYNVILRI